MDSVKVLRIIARIERAHDIELDDEVVFGVSTIGEIAAAIRELAPCRDNPRSNSGFAAATGPGGRFGRGAKPPAAALAPLKTLDA
jgi:hypothetical protein